jgi:hypothetical protein
MQHDHSLSVAATGSGMIGGVTHAISEQIILSKISLHGVVDVAFYALISASVGYCVKVVFDVFLKRFKKGPNGYE